MSDPLDRLPTSPVVFDAAPACRYLALRLEILIQDLSLAGDRKTAMALGGYLEGDEPPPPGVPDFIAVEAGRLRIENPPFLHAQFELSTNGEYTLVAEFDSDLHLLIDPPIRVTYCGDLSTVVADLEQTIAAVYRTRGRHLEKLHEGVVDQ